jgi:hypothetical protein
MHDWLKKLFSNREERSSEGEKESIQKLKKLGEGRLARRYE